MDPKDILNNLSSHLKNVVAKSIQYAATMKHFEVTPLHLLISIIDEPGCLGAEIVQKIEVKRESIEKMLTLLPYDESTQKQTTVTLPELNKNARAALEKAMLLAYEYGHKYVGTEHLLFGILEANDKHIAAVLKEHKLTKKDIEEQINTVLSSTSKFPDVTEVNEAMEELQDMVDEQTAEPNPFPGKTPRQSKQVTALDVFTTNLTEKEAQKNIDPVIGRSEEIERLIHILCRRTKNNPVLVGEPGVGKTAIVEGLAKRIVEGQVPDVLKSKKILSLDLALLISGTIYRGEFEARLKQTIEELSKRDDIILFIDELHNIIGAGSNQGTMDAANILKPALARGQLRCIGATTLDEYKKYISSDPALERRFQAITVEEPIKEDTIKIIEGLKENYENFHNVTITPEAIQAAVEMSTKYVHDNFLPDKAIDLIDEGAASVKVKQKSTPLQKELISLQQEKEKAEKEKHSAIVSEKFTDANKLKVKIADLEKRLTKLMTDMKQKKPGKRPLVQKEDIARILHQRLHIEEKILLSDEWTELKNLEKSLPQQIIGQDEIIKKVINTLKRSYLSGQNRKKPMASFLFAGPSGVGKTAMAKILATELYHNDQALIKLDMTEFAEQHGISKLLGSPAGYIGYKERNQFTDKMKRRPFSVILFDEVDKAHPDVVRLLLQILDEGELTDSAGKKINFKNAIIILTTNLGSEFYKSLGIGFGQKSEVKTEAYSKELEKSVVSTLRESLNPALVARLDEIVTFNPLSLETIEKIVKRRIDTLSSHLSQIHSLSITPDATAIQTLAKKAFNPDEGARLIEKTVDETINDLVITILESTQLRKKMVLKEKDGKFVLV